MKIRQLLSLVLGAVLAALAFVPAIVPAAPAEAAVAASPVQAAALKQRAGVTIKKLPTRYVGGSARATIKPAVSATGAVVVTKKTITVKQGAKTIAKNKKAVKLRAGTYKATVKVTYKTYKVVSGKRVYAAAKTFSATQTLRVKHLTKTTASGAGNCPSWAPIKGNNNSGIYHMPGQRYYQITKSNVTCYATQNAAVKDGFRAAKV